MVEGAIVNTKHDTLMVLLFFPKALGILFKDRV